MQWHKNSFVKIAHYSPFNVYDAHTQRSHHDVGWMSSTGERMVYLQAMTRNINISTYMIPFVLFFLSCLIYNPCFPFNKAIMSTGAETEQTSNAVTIYTKTLLCKISPWLDVFFLIPLSWQTGLNSRNNFMRKCWGDLPLVLKGNSLRLAACLIEPARTLAY